ncbi:hypothetical protein JX265_000085 [Neoarthrinium moseri]|uniref:Phospholipase/carboxylesterase/thioesterase domain-containing protein n=1 Tax=Neoarthrinium moseri TaxID=1658444 RepID=A0A9P9WXS0_9PEZI|nr:hypothetical protein JX266_008101 [Neoarthrinium moseri]KAI1881259.1 hypothetical protein JX265_000085 [Neoarthrinium moseri]
MADYPEPFVVQPRALPHKQTFILLHGRGSSGEKFGSVLLDTPISCPRGSSVLDNSQKSTLTSVFPHARFIFPSAARRRATVYKRALTHQWFDNWKLDPPATDREDLQVLGLQETTSYLHRILEREIALVPGGAKSVVFGGLSQGCAASLTALLLWEGDAFCAAVGMCGWLPFAARMGEQVGEMSCQLQGEDGGEDVFDPFARDHLDDDATTQTDPASRALSWLRDEIQVPPTQNGNELKFRDVPLFLGHGVQDDRVDVVLGQEASRCLTTLGMSVSWNEYGDLGHWYSETLLQDMVDFLRSHLPVDFNS